MSTIYIANLFILFIYASYTYNFIWIKIAKFFAYSSCKKNISESNC